MKKQTVSFKMIKTGISTCHVVVFHFVHYIAYMLAYCRYSITPFMILLLPEFFLCCNDEGDGNYDQCHRTTKRNGPGCNFTLINIPNKALSQ